MSTYFCRWIFGVMLAIAVVGVCAPSSAQAQSSPQVVKQFLDNPREVLQQFPNGGAKLISLIRDLALADPATLSVIIGLLSTASSDQQAAIGSGLGQAAQASVRTNQAYATQIQQALAASGNENAQTAFASVTGNVATGAAGGGGGGGGGGGLGGPTGSGGLGFGGSFAGGGQTVGQNGATSQQTFTGGGAGVTGASGSVSGR